MNDNRNNFNENENIQNEINETQKLFTEEEINDIVDEDYLGNTETNNKNFEAYVDRLVQKEFEKRKKQGRVKSLAKYVLAIILASSISIGGTGLYLKSNKGEKSTLNQSPTDKNANSTTVNNSGSTTVEKAVAEKAMSSVVGITTVGVSEDMFSNQKQTSGLGSGVIVSSEGYILTNNHVVDPSKTTSVTVILSDGTKKEAKVLWSDKTLDLAVIKIDPKGLDLKAVEFGDSSQVSIGDKAIAIGNPLGINLKSTLTSGYISGKDRVITLQDGSTMEGLFQTDAAINPGNSRTVL